MPKARYQPPFTLTGDIVTLVAEIAEQVGRMSAQPNAGMDLRLRRINRILQIHGTLALAGSSLSVEQVAAFMIQFEAGQAAHAGAELAAATSSRRSRGD